MSESPGLPTTVSVLTGIGALTAATLWGQASGDISSALLALDIAAGLASLALLPVLLRWPVPGALALAVLAALSPAVTPASTYATLHVSLRRRFPVAAAVAGASVAGLLIQGLWRPNSSLSSLWWVVLVLVAEAALVGWGELSQARQALLNSLREQAHRAEAEQAGRVAEARAAERASIAREMHDVLAHRLSLLATYAGALEYRPDAPPEQLARAAGVVRAGVHQALEELREVIGVLRDDDPVAVARPQPGLSDLNGLVEETRDAGTPVDLIDRISRPGELPDALGRTAYRIVQEGLTNARKHAPGRPARLLLDGRPGDRLLVELTNPVGPAPAGPANPVEPGSPAGPSLNGSGTGTGLIGLTERVRLAGGEIDHGVAQDGEFLLRALLPWPATQATSATPGHPDYPCHLTTPVSPTEPAEPGMNDETGGLPRRIRVLLVDDDALVRAGLTMMLDGAHGIEVVGEAADGGEVPAAVDAHGPDVVLMDLRMPRTDGITATRRLRARSNPPEVIVLTTFDADDNVLGGLRAGASGFLLKDSPPAQIVEAIRRVADGEPILSPTITRRLMDRAVAESGAMARARAAFADLTPREREVAVGIARGETNAEISARLFMSVATVKAHITHILTKLGATNRTQIALLGHDAGLV